MNLKKNYCEKVVDCTISQKKLKIKIPSCQKNIPLESIYLVIMSKHTYKEGIQR
jgi:hypothetical protein